MRFEAALFDVDGVLVDSPHERAWRAALETLMTGEWSDVAPRTQYAPERFTTAFYQRVLAGKPREDGARAALAAFDVPDAAARAAVYGERKQQVMLQLIQAGEFVAFPDATRFLLNVKGRGLPIAAASSSGNANLLLSKIRVDTFAVQQRALRPPPLPPGATLLDVFDANVCGLPVGRGKPAPDLFLAAARALSVSPRRCLVVEDAPSGVQAAKAGGMTALGVARLGDQALLVAAGADRVVISLDEIDPDAVAEGRLVRRAA